jgi:hypothetical protein
MSHHERDIMSEFTLKLQAYNKAQDEITNNPTLQGQGIINVKLSGMVCEVAVYIHDEYHVVFWVFNRRWVTSSELFKLIDDTWHIEAYTQIWSVLPGGGY